MKNVNTADLKTVNRKDITNAPYNPRKIDKDQAKRLKNGIQKFGLVEYPVWNKRTGNLVGGHQRIKILDSLEKTDNYDILVSVVDLNERDEKALNIQLNSASMQGEFDLDSLSELILSEGFSADDVGLSPVDMEILDIQELDLSAFDDAEEVTQAKNTLKEIKQHRADSMKKMKDEQSASFYFTVVCRDKEQRKNILHALRTPEYEDFIDGSFLEQVLKSEKDNSNG